jgi:hypothetical protein
LGFLSLNQFSRFGASLNRSTSDFSEEERRILELLRPHIVQAYESVRICWLLGKGLEAEGSAFLIADDRGRIGFTTSGAVALIERHFGKLSNE